MRSWDAGGTQFDNLVVSSEGNALIAHTVSSNNPIDGANGVIYIIAVVIIIVIVAGVIGFVFVKKRKVNSNKQPSAYPPPPPPAQN
jgi:hypothetical protein